MNGKHLTHLISRHSCISYDRVSGAVGARQRALMLSSNASETHIELDGQLNTMSHFISMCDVSPKGSDTREYIDMSLTN